MLTPWEYALTTDPDPSIAKPVALLISQVVERFELALEVLRFEEPPADGPLAGLALWLGGTARHGAMLQPTAKKLLERIVPATNEATLEQVNSELLKGPKNPIGLASWSDVVLAKTAESRMLTVNELGAVELDHHWLVGDLFFAILDHNAATIWSRRRDSSSADPAHKPSNSSTEDYVLDCIEREQATAALVELAEHIRIIAGDLLLTPSRGQERKVMLRPQARWRTADIGFTLAHLFAKGGPTEERVLRSLDPFKQLVAGHVRRRFLLYPGDRDDQSLRKDVQKTIDWWQEKIDQIQGDTTVPGDAQ